MLTEKTLKRLESIKKVSKERENEKIRDLYKLIINSPDLWMQAYSKIAANDGAMTPGVKGNTADGFSNEVIDKLIIELKQSKYRHSPVRRVYIPKANGKQRPLGIPDFQIS